MWSTTLVAVTDVLFLILRLMSKKLLDMNFQFHYFYLENWFLFLNPKNLFLSFYGDFGNAWVHGKPDLKQWKRDVGVQLRLNMVSFYAYLTALFFDSWRFPAIKEGHIKGACELGCRVFQIIFPEHTAIH